MKYRILVLGEPQTCSVAVLRIVETTEGVTVGRLLEFFGPDIDKFRVQNEELLDEVVDECLDRGCTFIDFYCTSPKTAAFFEECGFSRDDDGQLPSLLDPVDFSRKSQNLEFFVRPSLRREVPDWSEAFYATRGDGDQDRPNATFATARRIGE